VELKAYLWSGLSPGTTSLRRRYLPTWRAISLDEFTEAYGEEFDRQYLVAVDDPFTGAAAANGITSVTLGNADIGALFPRIHKDFKAKSSISQNSVLKLTTD
jgi:hypothetical protein